MIYKVKGRRNGRTYNLTWNNGQLEGDEIALKLVEIQADIKAGEPLGDMHYNPDGGYLTDPLAALLLMQDAFEEIEVEGDLPEAPKLPAGAIG